MADFLAIEGGASTVRMRNWRQEVDMLIGQDMHDEHCSTIRQGLNRPLR